MADLKVTELTALTTFSGDETFYVIEDDDGTPASRRVTVENLASGLVSFNTWRVVKRKTADESVTSSITLQNDDHLSFPIAANEVWVGRLSLHVVGDTAGDFTWDFTVPSGASGWHGFMGLTRSATTFEADAASQAKAFGTQASCGVLGASVGTLVIVEFYVANSSNAGTVQFQWAQRVSSGTATSVLTGSFLVADRIA